MNEPPQPPSLTPSYNERAKELQRVFAKFQEEVLLVVIGAYNAGRNEATAQLRDRLSGVLSAPLGDAQKVPSAGAKIAAQGKRAPRGTVRPAILQKPVALHGLTVGGKGKKTASGAL